ncbi:MAG: UvrD-helicase domain-containing protein, partial [Candidatus Omnitrophica bacterium]|nr:UvrD-helicase domain-containing protein [Candidatus Omnitrophota bacterium]
MAELTETQKQAVETIDRNVCVSAGAGTGKTRVLVERFIYLVGRKLARPNEILAITFTEKAAQEMKTRIAKRLREQGLEQARRELENAYIGTIHAFCARVLREHPIEAGVDPDFRVIEEDEAEILKETVLDELIESRFQEQAIFDLLRIYGEEGVRQAVKDVVEKVRLNDVPSPLSGGRFPPNCVADPRNDGGNAGGQGVIASAVPAGRQEAPAKERGGSDTLFGGKQSKTKVLDALTPLRMLKDKESDCAELEIALQTSLSRWEDLEKIKEIGKRFRKQGKAKSEVEGLRDALDEWISFCAESLGRNLYEVFLDLTADFEVKYQALKRERSSLDFNDLEREAVRLLSGNDPRSVACKNLYRNHFKFVMVDEFQDTSPIQDQLMGLVARDDNLFIVGDWKQSIYGFRGADASLFLEREKAFSSGGGVRLPLVQNFRSRP